MSAKHKPSSGIQAVLSGKSTWHLEQGDNRVVLATMPDACIDAVVCDPPYELGFLGKSWDSSGIAYSVDLWREVLRVLKPGGHLVAFGGTRTYHRMTCAIEDAGFEVRDCLAWLYGSGFPKSLKVSQAIDKAAGALGNIGKNFRVDGDVGTASYRPTVDPREYVPPLAATEDAKAWQGWGTALKPAFEPAVLARKPLSGTVAANVIAHGTGALNVDACRIAASGRPLFHFGTGTTASGYGGGFGRSRAKIGVTDIGRWPANVVLSHDERCVMVGTREVKGGAGTKCSNRDETGKCRGHRNAGQSTSGETFHGPDTSQGDGTETVEAWECVEDCPVRMLDEQSGDRPGGAFPASQNVAPGGSVTMRGGWSGAIQPARSMGDNGGASRFFYTAKASTSEREKGLEHRKRRKVSDGRDASADNPRLRGETERANIHPTVKPVDLMRWLVRLTCRKGGLVLDPFAGSGSTIIAALAENMRAIGIELEAEHVEIARDRIVGDNPLFNRSK